MSATVISLFNNKGGVGKTTSTINIAAELAENNGCKVLIIDTDPQANCTEGLGIREHDTIPNLLDVFNSDNPDISEAITSIEEINNLDIVPATNELSAIELSGEIGVEMLLKQAVKKITDDYDYIFLDLPPSLGKISTGALIAAQYILIPIQSEYYPLRGIKSLMKAFKRIKNRLNPELTILGAFVTMYDQRTNISKEAEKQIKNVFGDKVFNTRIRRNVTLAEAPSEGIPVVIYDDSSYGAEDYKELTNEVKNRVQERA
ncbi:MAG: ParA family protein [Nanoarchaeota archaeon]